MLYCEVTEALCCQGRCCTARSRRQLYSLCEVLRTTAHTSRALLRGPPRWPSGYGVRLESGRSRVRIPLAPGFFRGQVRQVIKKLALQWLPCQAPGGIGSVLALVGLVSVYCDWVRWKVGSATSVSVWQHVNLSEQIHP